MRGKRDDLSGLKYGKLTVLHDAGKTKHGNIRWLCKCECGTEKVVTANHLKSGKIVSCGCYLLKKAITHGMNQTKIYKNWATMKSRCKDKNNPKYKDYGGRGITVCEEWNKFENFKKWAFANGYSDDLQIDRKNNDGGYNPDNCRYVTRVVNMSNRRNTLFIEINGVTKPIMEWCYENGLKRSCVYDRWKNGVTGLDLLKPSKRQIKTNITKEGNNLSF